MFVTCPGCRRPFVVPVPPRAAAVTCPRCRTRVPVGRGDRPPDPPADDPPPAGPPADPHRPPAGS